MLVCGTPGAFGDPRYCKSEFGSLLCRVLDVLSEGEFVVEYDSQVLGFIGGLDRGVADVNMCGGVSLPDPCKVDPDIFTCFESCSMLFPPFLRYCQ